ncbi:glycosyl hydrolase family 71-domain-containing protein [Leucosporidium creatinivorum]|uniref:Glycosyl hydrolase family 71-domain-containing protein n=1 Tax=Leucosporidium creatinivorum TaxID=106004 RepID=A0A1Y2CDB5_9BASI|nr:glycosyl hydrolase family 71-domain-containing protein [Leucosporidium creatinivorum]
MFSIPPRLFLLVSALCCTAVLAGDSTKAVFAHVVQGDFQNYAQQDYEDDMTLALTAGISAFAMNVGHDTTDSDQMTKAFAAAEAVGFKLFFSFDMVYFSNADGSRWIYDEYLTPFGPSSAHYTYDSKIFVSTFSGEVDGRYLDAASSFDDSNTAWSTLFDKVKSGLGLDVYYAPDWNDVSKVPSNTWGGAQMFWEAWPAKGSADDLTLDTANSYMSACTSAGLDLLAPVGAFFQVHQNSGNNYVYNSNNFLLPNHYTDLINMSPGPQFIELLSWNDFGEAHYLGPVRSSAGIPSGAEGYATDKFDHTPMLTLSAYYNSWFVNGAPPTIKTEGIVWWYRPHPKDLVASSDSVDKPEGADTMDDSIYVAVLIPSGSSAANVIITVGGTAGDPTAVSEGVNLIQADLKAGDTAVELVDSSGNSLLSGSGDSIASSIETYNFNYHCYVLPADADASTLFDMGSTASGATGTTSKTSMTTITAARESRSATATAAVNTGTSSGATSSAAATSGSGSGSNGDTTSSAAKTSSTSSGSTSTSDSSSDSSSSSPLSAEYMGLKMYWWIAIIAAIPVLLLVAYIVVAHGSNKPKTSPSAGRRKRTKDVESDDTDSELDGGSSRDGDTSTDDSDQNDHEKTRLKR